MMISFKNIKVENGALRIRQLLYHFNQLVLRKLTKDLRRDKYIFFYRFDQNGLVPGFALDTIQDGIDRKLFKPSFKGTGVFVEVYFGEDPVEDIIKDLLAL